MKTVYIIIICFFHTLNLFSQNNDSFYVGDTITIKNPVVFSIKEYDGYFLTELEHLNKKNIKLKSIIKNAEIYLFSFNPYQFFNANQLNKNKIFTKYPNNGNCSFSQNVNCKDSIYYNTFKIKPSKFIVCFIKASYYNKIISSSDIGKTALHNADENSYFKLAFPLCE
jgi:hypothetical protein